MTAEKTLIVEIPFDGFYESLSHELVERALQVSEDDAYNLKNDYPKEADETEEAWEKRLDEIFQERIDNADYSGARVAYAKKYAEAFAKDNGIKMQYESLSSPRFYNFTTDRIFCTISQEEMQKLYDRCDKAKLAALIEEKFTSRDGFSSFYSGDASTWDFSDLSALDHNELGVILECATADHIAEENKEYPYIAKLMDDFCF